MKPLMVHEGSILKLSFKPEQILSSNSGCLNNPEPSLFFLVFFFHFNFHILKIQNLEPTF